LEKSIDLHRFISMERGYKMSRYENDNELISMIQFRTDYDRKTKNKMISVIERRMEIEEQKELDGNGTGYYDN